MLNDKVVAFVEPSFYGVSFVEAAYSMGCKVISIVSSTENPDLYGYSGKYHDLLIADIRDVDSVLSAIENSKYSGKLDALIPATDFASHVTARVAEIIGLRGIPFDAVLQSRNKDLARETYEKCNVPSAKYAKVKTYVEAELAAQQIGYPVVLKPTNCASSQGVYFVNNSRELKKAMEELKDFKVTYMNFKVRDEYLIEEYIDGPEFSVELFLDEGKPIFCAITEKITSPLPYFVETLHTLPSPSYKEHQQEMVDTALLALEAIGITNGPSHVEVKLSSIGPRIIEVNGRPGGDNISSDLLMNAFNFNIFKATVLYYLGLIVKIPSLKKKASSIAYLTADKNGTISSIKGIKAISNNSNVLKFHLNVKPGDQVSIAKSSDDRLGYVITCCDTPEESKEIASNLIKNIKLEYVKSKQEI